MSAARLRAVACALAAASLLAAPGCAARTPGALARERAHLTEIQALAFRFIISRHPRAGRFELAVEGRDPDRRVMARLAAHHELAARDARTLAVAPADYRPGFEPDRTVVVALGVLETRDDGALALVASHGAPGEPPRICPMTFVRRSGVWGLTRASAPGCRLSAP